MKKRLLLIFCSLLFLTSCNVFDYSLMNETYKPNLMASPINGVWKVSESIISEARTAYEEEDRFYFNVDFFASEDKIYLSPEYEIIKVNWDRYISSSRHKENVEDLISNDEVNLLEIKKDGIIIAEVIPVSNDTVLLIINNELVKLVKEKDNFTEAEKNQIRLSYLEEQKVFDSENNWNVAIGLRYSRHAEDSFPNYEYKTELITNSDSIIRDRELEGLFINNGTDLDVYKIFRDEINGQLQDTIYLNDNPLQVINRPENKKSNMFRINYLSNNYATLEYIHQDSLNILNTYSSNTKEGFQQLRMEDMVDFSYDRIMDVINSSNTNTTFAQTVYNIGITRENGFTVLKGRVPTLSGDELYNRDFIISSNFSYVENINQILNFEYLNEVFPNAVDIYPTNMEDQIIVINKNSIQIINIDRSNRSFKKIFEKAINPNTTVVSVSFISDIQLEDFDQEIISRRAK